MSKRWLSLIEYSTAYGISVSTLRRRIRNNEISYQQLGGKYFVEDPLMASTEIEAADLSGVSGSGVENPIYSQVEAMTISEKLVQELKSAFRLVLQEKEEQIYLLKEEISHLNKLVAHLEEDNIRLKDENGLERKKGRGETTTLSKSLSESFTSSTL